MANNALLKKKGQQCDFTTISSIVSPAHPSPNINDYRLWRISIEYDTENIRCRVLYAHIRVVNNIINYSVFRAHSVNGKRTIFICQIANHITKSNCIATKYKTHLYRTTFTRIWETFGGTSSCGPCILVKLRGEKVLKRAM